MNTTKTRNETTTRTEWGVERTWADGHVEYERKNNRDHAEISAGLRHPQRSQRVVRRTVTTTAWTVV